TTREVSVTERNVSEPVHISRGQEQQHFGPPIEHQLYQVIRFDVLVAPGVDEHDATFIRLQLADLLLHVAQYLHITTGTEMDLHGTWPVDLLNSLSNALDLHAPRFHIRSARIVQIDIDGDAL